MENTKIKIFVGIIVMLGILSMIFLVTSKKKPIKRVNTQTQTQAVANPQPNKTIKTEAPAANGNNIQTAPKITEQQRIANVKSQWEKCKNSTLPVDTKLFWKIQVTEAIPAGGTYAKGFLENDQALPVHVIIKSDSQITDKIKGMLVVGKDAFVRGNCTSVASDGSVVLQAF